MNNQIAPKQAVLSDLAPNWSKRRADLTSRREHHSGPSDRTDSFGSVLRRATKKSRDGRADTGRRMLKARAVRRSATIDRAQARDRQADRAVSLDRSNANGQGDDVNTFEERQPDEASRIPEHDHVSLSNESQRAADPASMGAQDLALNRHLGLSAVELEPEGLASAGTETADATEGAVTQSTVADPVENGTGDGGEPLAELTTAPRLGEAVPEAPSPNPGQQYGETGHGLSSDSHLDPGIFRVGIPPVGDTPVDGVDQKDSNLAVNGNLAQRADRPAVASDLDGNPLVTETLAEPEEGLDPQDANLEDTNLEDTNSAESQAHGDRPPADPEFAGTTRSGLGHPEAVHPASGAGLPRDAGAPLASPILATGSSLNPTPVADAIPEPNPADIQMLSADVPSTDGRPGDAVLRQVQRAIGAIRNLGEGDHEFTIRLTPRELGSVTIDIRSSEGSIAIGLVTETTAASDRLNEQRDQLLQELAASGLDSSSVAISQDEPSFGPDSYGAGTGPGKEVIESERVDPMNSDQQRGKQSDLLPRRALGANELAAPGRLDIAL